MYYCMYNNNISTYLNVLSFDNSITFLNTYHDFSVQLKLMISLEVRTWWSITLANYKENVRATGRMDVSSTHQVSFVCIYT